MKRIVLWLVLILFNACGVLLIYTAVNHYSTAGAAKDWPTVQGTVLSAKVREVKGNATNRKRGEAITYSYFADMKYQYTIDGVEYQGDKITVEDFGTQDRERAEQIAMQYQTGQNVTVYYNPTMPQEALLKPGDSGGALGTLILGILFMVLPTAMVIFVGGASFFHDYYRFGGA